MPFPPRPARVLLLIVLFLGSLFLSAGAIRPFLPFPDIEGIAPRLAWLKENGADYDTLFVGSSRIFWHIVPEEFDAAMSAAGQPTRSFNLGYQSVRPPEDSYLLQRALTGRRAPLRYVIVEADEIELEIRDATLGTSRLAYWHDIRRMRALVSEALSAGEAGASAFANFDEHRESLQLLGHHLQPFLAWAVNLGRGPAFLAPPARDEPEWKELIGPRFDGFTEAKEDPLSPREAKRLRTALKETRVPPRVATAAGQWLFADMERRITAAGARMIVVVAPRFDPGPVLPDPRLFPNVPVFDFSDPARYPQLFEARHRYDAGHLNRLGSTLFTRELVQRLLEARLPNHPAP